MITVGVASGFAMLGFLIYAAILGVSIYCLVLFIMLAKRGIKALDVYLSKNTYE